MAMERTWRASARGGNYRRGPPGWCSSPPLLFTTQTPLSGLDAEGAPVLDARAAQQARRLHQSLVGAGISVPQLWCHYFSLGGNARLLEVDAYVHQGLRLPALERLVLDQAAEELLAG